MALLPGGKSWSSNSWPRSGRGTRSVRKDKYKNWNIFFYVYGPFSFPCTASSVIFFVCDAKNIWPLYILCLHSCRWFIQKLHSVLQTNCQCLVDVRGSGHHRSCLKGARFFKHSLGNIVFPVHLMCCKFLVLWYYDKFNKHKNRPNVDVILVVSLFANKYKNKQHFTKPRYN